MNDMNPNFVKHDEPEADSAVKHRIRSLLQRYPATTTQENHEIAHWLKHGQLLDIGLLKGDETVRYKIAAFEQEHRQAITSTPMEMVVLIIIFAITALVCAALWDFGQ